MNRFARTPADPGSAPERRARDRNHVLDLIVVAALVASTLALVVGPRFWTVTVRQVAAAIERAAR